MIRSGPLNELGSAVKACLVAGIPGAAPLALNAGNITSDLSVIVREGLAPIAIELLGCGSTTADAQVRDQLARAAMAQQIRALAAEGVLGHLLDVLEPSGIPFVIIKGPAVARFHPHGWPRPYSDIDLLVEPRQFQPAMTLLLQRGFIYPATSLTPWSWFDRYCREGLNLNGVGNVDLHHHLAPWIFGVGLPSADVIGAADHVVLRGRSVPVASPQHSAVIAALHILNDLWKGQRGLVSWRDLLFILRRYEFGSIHAAFQASGIEWLLDVVVSELRRQLPGFLPEVDDSDATRLSSRVAWRVRALGWDRSTPISRHRLAWTLRLPASHAAAYMLGSAFPSRRYIRARHGSYRTYWHQAWTETLDTFAGADHRLDKDPVKRVSPS